MFELYTEKARRVIFFARYEASQFGSPYIETEHILLGLLREDKALSNRFLSSHASMDAIRKQIEGHRRVRETVSTSVDLPLSNESKRVLGYAAEEAQRLAHHHIGTEHLLLGMLREEKCFAAEILHERGLRLSSIREELARVQARPDVTSPQEGRSLLTSFARDLTQSALDNELVPFIGRADELRSVLHILSGRNRNSVVLVGETGVGKTAIVEGLARQIADSNAPAFLAEERILEFDLSRMAAGCTRAQFAERMYAVVKEAAQLQDPILFFRELTTLAGLGLGGWLDAVNILRPALSRGEMQCITEATAADYEATLQTIPWLATCTRVVSVSPLSEEETLQVLQSQKAQYEKFHSVTYSNAALERAAGHANGYPARALDVLDMAGTIVKLRQGYLSAEINELQKRIHFIHHRMEPAIANHEFEKARFYFDEEKKERENLRVLREKHRLDEPSTGSEVRLEDMEAAILRVTS